MFRILLVEDILITLEVLRGLLHEVFPDALIETASTVVEGQDKIRTAAMSNQPFDICILDFKLSAQKGLNPEIDESLCQEIKFRMPGTLVMHITAFLDDPAVIKHKAQHHTGKNDPRVEVIEKNHDWPQKLLSEIKGYLIERQLKRLVEKQVETAETHKSSRNAGSSTQMLATLSRNIVAYWHDLDDATKAKIRDHFETNEDQEQVRVSLRLRK